MTPADERVSMLIQRALKASTPTMGDIAKRLGVSYDAVRSWSIGRSSPQADNVQALALYLDEQADVLRGIAAELRNHEKD